MTSTFKTTSSVPAIELKDVRFSYSKDRPFMKGLSTEFSHGLITSVIGPNGCGKSTLVKLVDGIARPFAGEVLIDGESTSRMGHMERARKVAVLAQATRPPAMTVEDLVACGRYPHLGRRGRLGKQDKELAEEAMHLTGVERYRNCDLRQLSGGERQRAFIAMTLAQDTRIILLDEPTTFLDIGACHDLMSLIQRLNEEQNKTFVMVIHDLDLALRYSHKLAVMERGNVTFAGSVDEALRSGAINQAFNVNILPQIGPAGRNYAVFPQRSNE